MVNLKYYREEHLIFYYYLQKMSKYRRESIGEEVFYEEAE
jgi:hypothetical protein